MRRHLTTLACLLALAPPPAPAAERAVVLREFVVNADRQPVIDDAREAATRWFDAAALAAPLAVDQALRAEPAFSLFRRSDSLAANPTAQGVSLRGLGPSGASRSLVLLDGVPLNDPFGGWVAWTQLAPLSLASAELRAGGGSAAWGNAALGGTIALRSASPTRPTTRLRLSAASWVTHSAELSLATTDGRTALQVDARDFSTAGFNAVRAGDRGAVDRPLEATHQVLQLQLAQQLGPVAARLSLRHFAEERGNGTELQRNRSQLDGASLALHGPVGATATWQFTAYRQAQVFRSSFSAVSADRSSETPANDQFAVPADAAGAALLLTSAPGGTTWTVGADWRAVRGETREDFQFASGAFTRRRHAGGSQSFAGLFASAAHAWTERLTAEARLRVDRWANTDGHRREANLATGATTRDELYAARRGTEPSGTLALHWRVAPEWSAHASAYTAFRVPTLNELYRPFRVGSTNTEANPALATETLRGAEASLAWQRGGAAASVTAFAADLRDAVANVTLATTPTLTSRQRLNLARVEVRGLEGRARWTWTRGWSAEVAALWSEATVAAAPVQPTLVGRRLAQVPRLTLTSQVAWQPDRRWRLSAAWRAATRQFEDDENQLPLAGAATLDLGVERALSPACTLQASVDNALDARVATGRSLSGPTTYAAPRAWRLGLRLEF